MRAFALLSALVLAPLALGAAGNPSVVPAALPAIPRAPHTATSFPGGRVLVTGGCVVDGCSRATAPTELYRSRLGFSGGPRLTVPRAGHTGTRLPRSSPAPSSFDAD